LELSSTETHVKLGDLLRSSGLGTNQQSLEEHYFQALKDIARLEKLTFLVERPSLLYNLRTDQVASHLGLGCLYRDQHLFDKALSSIDGLNSKYPVRAHPGIAVLPLENSRKPYKYSASWNAPSRDLYENKLMETLISMADTLETLELYEESQATIKEAQAIGNRALCEDNTSQLHLHQSIAACTKHTMDARRDLDDHTPTLHIGSKICLHGLTNQALNGKKGTVLGTANNNRIGIQL